ncbi:hypothetical protein Nepgr_005271 [Nepenthes gracilis]|uniref:Uncharacterized protein n=1 Tax=Nepenthes gracilis TaxID=150966 RepID=A0AAD3XG97_NEPGR|nr:hypothetical protein Nepgr_005271 [Nepenthes gracilis]
MSIKQGIKATNAFRFQPPDCPEHAKDDGTEPESSVKKDRSRAASNSVSARNFDSRAYSSPVGHCRLQKENLHVLEEPREILEKPWTAAQSIERSPHLLPILNQHLFLAVLALSDWFVDQGCYMLRNIDKFHYGWLNLLVYCAGAGTVSCPENCVSLFLEDVGSAICCLALPVSPTQPSAARWMPRNLVAVVAEALHCGGEGLPNPPGLRFPPKPIPSSLGPGFPRLRGVYSQHPCKRPLVKEVEVSFSKSTLPISEPLQAPTVIPEVDFVVKPSVALPMSDPDGQITTNCEALEVIRPVCSAVDSDESMPPNESGHDSVQTLSTVYPDYGALDSSAVSVPSWLHSSWSLMTKGRRMSYLPGNATEVGGYAACEVAEFLWVSSCLLMPEVRKLLAYGDSAVGCVDAQCYAVSMKGSAARLHPFPVGSSAIAMWLGLQPDSSKPAPPDQSKFVQQSPLEHLTTDMDSCKVNNPLLPSGSPHFLDSLCEALSQSTLDASNLKEEADCLSSVNEVVSHSPPCEATIILKVPYNGSSTGNELLSHSSPVVELVEHAGASSSMPLLSFADVNYLDLVKHLAPVDAHRQLRTQIVEGPHITAADVGGLDDVPPSGPPVAGLDTESDDYEPTPSPISHLASKYGLASLKQVGAGPVSPIEPSPEGLMELGTPDQDQLNLGLENPPAQHKTGHWIQALLLDGHLNCKCSLSLTIAGHGQPSGGPPDPPPDGAPPILPPSSPPTAFVSKSLVQSPSTEFAIKKNRGCPSSSP